VSLEVELLWWRFEQNNTKASSEVDDGLAATAVPDIVPTVKSTIAIDPGEFQLVCVRNFAT
jgi:hypothetical protein